jgi:membrane protease YdiL (CAAX protease family)
MSGGGILLRGRWLYACLLAVVVTVYGGLLITGLRPDRASTNDQPAIEAVEATPAQPAAPWQTQINRERAIKTLKERPGLAVLIGLWSSVALGLVATGLMMSWSIAVKRRLPPIFDGPARALPVWKLGELIRIVLLVAFVLALLPFVHVSLTAWSSMRLIDDHLWSLVAMLVLEGWFVLVVWAFAAGKSKGLLALLGMSRRTALRSIRQGLAGYAAVFPWIFALLFVVVRACQAIGLEPPVEEIHKLLFERQGPLVLGLTLVLACVVGPAIEELFFRGVLFAALRSRTSKWVAMLASGALFALVHTNIVGFVPIMALGCFLAALYERTGSLLSPIAVHVFHNTLLVGIGLSVKELL